MNAPLPRDFSPSHSGTPEVVSGRLWSLWDMINLKFGMVVELARRLEAVRLKFKSLNDNGDGARKIGDADGMITLARRP
jgi:hypothetical protein